MTVVDALPPNASIVGFLNFMDDGSVYFQSSEQNMPATAVPTVSVVQSGVNEQEAAKPIVAHAATRKRLRKDTAWKRNKRKRARTHGLPYINTVGKHIEGKQPVLQECLCTAKCRWNCSDNFSDADRQRLFVQFYDLDSEAQKLALTACFEAYKPLVTVRSADKHRQLSFRYFVTVNRRIRVCKKALQALYQVSRGRLNGIAERICQGTAATPSRQGKHKNRPNKTPEAQIQQVVEHIGLFPAESSHYSCSHNPNRKYLSSLLTINKMYEEYKRWCASKGYKPVSASMYRNVFNTRFNLAFGSPRTDTCSKCDSQSADEDHKLLAEAGFQCMSSDRKRATEHPLHYVRPTKNFAAGKTEY